MQTTQPKHAGINLGFGFTKVHTESQEFCFASLVTQEENDLTQGLAATDCIKVNGKLYGYGERAAIECSGVLLKSLHRDWVDTINYNVLAHAVAERLAVSGDHWQIVVGAAISHYRDKQARKRIEDFWKKTFHTKNGDVTISQCLVVPEPMGAMSYYCEDPRVEAAVTTGDSIILDFGRLTTNWLKLKNGKPIGSESNSVDYSVGAVLTEALPKIVLATGRPNLTEFDVEIAYMDKGQITYRSDPRTAHDVQPQIDQAVQTTWQRISQAIYNSTSLMGLDIYLAGGGAHMFEALIRDKLPHGASIAPIPHHSHQMANARGYYVIAKSNFPT